MSRILYLLPASFLLLFAAVGPGQSQTDLDKGSANPIPSKPPSLTDPVVLPGTSVSVPPAPFYPFVVWPGTSAGATPGQSQPFIVWPGTSAGATPGQSQPFIVWPGTSAGATPGQSQPFIVWPGTSAGATPGQSQPVVVPLQNAPQLASTTVKGQGSVQTTSAAISVASGAQTSAIELAVPAPRGVPLLNFMDLDSRLRDCHIPFNELKERSPFCQGEEKDRMCQRYSAAQFPEVLRLAVVRDDGSKQYCSGTLIANDWVLTAAHCFVGEASTSSYTGDQSRDFEWQPELPNQLKIVAVVIDGANLKISDRRRFASRAVVYARYAGRRGVPQFDGDLALVRLEKPYPTESTQPATLASKDEFSVQTTIGGYGFTNIDGASFGEFNLGWPGEVRSESAGQFSFAPQQGVKESRFCKGDSGGSVFAERVRGCKAADIVPEARPRRLQGLISYNYLGMPNPDTVTEAQREASACFNGTKMVMQDVTQPDRQQWMCRITQNSIGGCR